MNVRPVALACWLTLGCGVWEVGEKEASCCAIPAHEGSATVDQPDYVRNFENYRIPDLTLVDQDGGSLGLREALESDRAVVLNFVFTTCNTICPVMSATFAELHRSLGEDADEVRMVSISIDPEYDRPRVLKEYLRTYRAHPDWHFLTGDADQIATVLTAFDALTGSKMNHRPYTYFKLPGIDEWMRIEGLASAADLAGEYRRLRDRHAP